MSLRIGLRFVATALALCASGALASAQNKIAVINLQQAVLGSAEIKKASAELEAKFKPRANQIDQLQKDIANISQQLQSGSGKLSPAAEADLNAQGQRKQRDLQRLQEDLQADVDRERNEILSKSTQKMIGVVKKIAEEKGYDAVVDVNNIVYFKPAMEITADAVTEYDKAYPAK
ncbi:MAG TPA: OmpH family outer membrane protein [Bryobacteraceae bacterium]|nr:OmpH family outer membrane protein [Bryobacteraceae bacterium]